MGSALSWKRYWNTARSRPPAVAIHWSCALNRAHMTCAEWPRYSLAGAPSTTAGKFINRTWRGRQVHPAQDAHNGGANEISYTRRLPDMMSAADSAPGKDTMVSSRLLCRAKLSMRQTLGANRSESADIPTQVPARGTQMSTFKNGPPSFTATTIVYTYIYKVVDC